MDRYQDDTTILGLEGFSVKANLKINGSGYGRGRCQNVSKEGGQLSWELKQSKSFLRKRTNSGIPKSYLRLSRIANIEIVSKTTHTIWGKGTLGDLWDPSNYSFFISQAACCSRPETLTRERLRTLWWPSCAVQGPFGQERTGWSFFSTNLLGKSLMMAGFAWNARPRLMEREKGAELRQLVVERRIEQIYLHVEPCSSRGFNASFFTSHSARRNCS